MSIKGCILPWIHVHGSITGQYKICCTGEGGQSIDQYNLGTQNESILDVWNNDSYKKIRKNFLDGKIPAQCQKVCYDKEKDGGYSQRLDENHRWKSYQYLQEKEFTDKNGNNKSLPIYIDIRFGNICNFRCRMCNSYASSQWGKEDILLGKKPFPIVDTWTNNNVLWEDLKKLLPYIKEIYFAGGEPSIQEGHYKLLHFLIENKKSKNIELVYNTNLSMLRYKNENLYKLWDKFKNVKIWVSQDGYKEVGEYIRKELDWKLFDYNFKKIIKYIDSITCTYQVYNVYSFLDLYSYAKRNNKIIYPSLLTDPSCFCAQILPKNEKKKIASHYKNFLKNNLTLDDWEIKKILKLLTWLMHEPENREQSEKEFKRRTEILDRSRNEKFTEVIPQLAEWYKNI